MKKYTCDKCGKEIKREEATNSCLEMRKSMKDNDPHIFDVWFWNYCTECADKYIQEKENS